MASALSLNAYIFECDVCHQMHPSRVLAITHAVKVHQLDVTSIRDLVTRELLTPQASDSIYPCTFCDKIFTVKGSLRGHTSKQHDFSRRTVKYKCTVCDTTFTQKKPALTHGETIHPLSPESIVIISTEKPLSAAGIEKLFYCTACKVDFVRSCSIYKHVNNSHDGDFSVIIDKVSNEIFKTTRPTKAGAYQRKPKNRESSQSSDTLQKIESEPKIESQASSAAMPFPPLPELPIANPISYPILFPVPEIAATIYPPLLPFTFSGIPYLSIPTPPFFSYPSYLFPYNLPFMPLVNPLYLQPIQFASPVIETHIEPKVPSQNKRPIDTQEPLHKEQKTDAVSDESTTEELF